MDGQGTKWPRNWSIGWWVSNLRPREISALTLIRNIELLSTICLHMIRKAHAMCNFNCLIKTEWFLKVAQAVRYAVKVVMSRKRCKIETMLQQTTNRKWYMACRIAAISTSQFLLNNAKYGPLRRSRSFKVTDFHTSRKLICNFLLVINTNLRPILHSFRDMAFNRSKIGIFGYPSCV